MEGDVALDGVTVVHGVNHADLDSQLCLLLFALVTMYVTHILGFGTLASSFVQWEWNYLPGSVAWEAYTAGVQSW